MLGKKDVLKATVFLKTRFVKWIYGINETIICESVFEGASSCALVAELARHNRVALPQLINGE